MRILQLLLLAAAVELAPQTVEAATEDETSPDAAEPEARLGYALDIAAPERGKWVFEFRQMYRGGTTLYDESGSVEQSQVAEEFAAVPLRGDGHESRISFAYGAARWLSITLGSGFGVRRVDFAHRSGRTYQQQSSGLVDTTLDLIWHVLDLRGHRLSLATGASFPTGSIGEKDVGLGGDSETLGYALQIGSGTVDPRIGVVYRGRRSNWVWGGRYLLTLRLYDNRRDYRLGQEQRASVFFGRQWFSQLALGLRADLTWMGALGGKDSELRGGWSPLSQTEAAEGTTLDIVGTISLHGKGPVFARSSLIFDIGGTVLNRVKGPRLGSSVVVGAAWQQSW